MAEADLVTVFEPRDVAEQHGIEALLAAAEIPFVTRNEGLQDLAGLGRIGGSNRIFGEIEIRVEAADVERARGLVRDALTAELPQELQPEPEAETSPDAAEELRIGQRSAMTSLVFAVIWLGGVGSILAIFFGLKALAFLEGKSVPDRSRGRAWLGLGLGVAGLVIWGYVWIFGDFQ